MRYIAVIFVMLLCGSLSGMAGCEMSSSSPTVQGSGGDGGGGGGGC